MSEKAEQITDILADQARRLNNLYFVRDKDGKVVPFRLNGMQEQLLEGLWFWTLVLKARQRGASTFLMLLGLDTALFTPDYAAATIAHRLESAEDLFERNVAFPYSRLPDGIRGSIGLVQERSRHYRFSNGSSYKVDVSARSGSLQFLHVSEFGKICATAPQRAREIVTGSFEAVGKGNIIAVESTAEGREGYFFDFCQQAIARRQQGLAPGWQDFRLLFFPWWQEPSYRLSQEQAAGSVVITQERETYFQRVEATIGQSFTTEQKLWYTAKAQTLGEDMLREYPSTEDEAFAASIQGAYYQSQLAKARVDGRVGRVAHEPALGVETWWDLGMDDATAIWFVQRHGLERRVIDYIEDSGEGLEYYAGLLMERRVERKYVYTRHYAPHDIAVRELGTGLSRHSVARGLGIDFQIVPSHRVEDGIQAVRAALATCWFDEERCSKGLAALQSYRKEWDERLGTYKNRPLHDHASHGSDAFRTGVMGSGGNRAIAQHKERPKAVGWT